MWVVRFLMGVLTGLFFGWVPPELIAWLRDAPDPALPMLRQRHPRPPAPSVSAHR